MEVVKIVIQSLDDLKSGKPIIDGKPTMIPLKDITIGILEGGMTSGATSLSIILRDGDKAYMGEMSIKHLSMLVSAVNGAEARFQDERDERGRKARMN